jgi:hypothetical protein
MKNFDVAGITALITISLFLFGCGRLKSSDAEADGKFPAAVGSFRREIVYKEKENNYLNEKNKNQKYKSSDAKYSDGDDDVFYGISAHQKADDAINEQEKEASYGNNVVWKRADLKDKSGKKVGKLTICRMNDYSANAQNSIGGGFNYSVAFNIDNQNHHAALTNSSRKWTPQTTDKFVAFVKSLPAASQIDLSALDLITTSYAEKGVTVDKLSAISPPVKIAPAPYLKGKTAVISTGTFSDGVVTDEYIKDAAAQANLMDEVGSIVKVECGKGASIGQYVVKEKGTKIPAFSSFCKATIIDNTIPAVIAQKTFTNSTMVDNILVDADKKGKLYDYNKEYVAALPTSDIADFLQKLPKK